MKVSSINSQVELSQNRQKKYSYAQKTQSPAFKSVGMTSMLGMSAALMQWIESKGYLVSFLIQDGLGMTAPRVWTGFNRDKEITGQYNMQEGFEVLGREGITGPYIIGVAPAVLFLTGKFCKSTNTNTRLIKRMAQNMKSMIAKPEFNQAVKNDAQKFKQEYTKILFRMMLRLKKQSSICRKNLENILPETKKLYKILLEKSMTKCLKTQLIFMQ